MQGKYRISILLLMLPLTFNGQRVDSSYLKSLYDHCLDFSEDKIDSLKYYADYIEKQSKLIHFSKGDVLSLRLKGLNQELEYNYEKAVDFYLQSLDAARKIQGTEYESAALSDLSIVYFHLKRPDKAKEVYLESARLSAIRGDVKHLIAVYANLGAIYNQLNLPDSAMIFLKEGLRISKVYENKMDLSSLYNNTGNMYYRLSKYDEALSFFSRNKLYHITKNLEADLWLDYLNISEVLTEKKEYDSAAWYGENSLQLARKLLSKGKESDSYAILSKLYSRKGEYKKAFLFKEKWYSIDTAIVNSEVNQSITGLQERYNAKERERQNLLLGLAIEKEKLRSNMITYLAIAAGLVATIVAIFLVLKRKANKKLVKINDLITRQNKKLAELNYEKNFLISMVSHDLSSPFASIKMWGNVLQSDGVNLNSDQRKAIDKIVSSTLNGEKLIRTILDVEKAGTNQRPVQLENLDLNALVENVVNGFIPDARKKDITLIFKGPSYPIFLITDQQFIIRICENLLSNALKFTPVGRQIWINLLDEKFSISLEIKDEGIGISASDMTNLYSKYSKLSSRPTNGEASTGLGLHIVKRLVEELNGEISCNSIEGTGTVFTVVLKK